MPLHFEQNRGQSPGEVRYLARAAGYHTYLTDAGARVALRDPRRDGSTHSVRAFDIRFPFASAAPRIESEDPLPGRVNYLRGDDPLAWQTDVPTFGRVRYRQIYPGIDLVFYGNERQLEYDFVLEPGADHRQVRLEFGGIDRMQIGEDGDLLLHVGDRHIVQRKPVVYQIADGRRRPVEGAYTKVGVASVGFAIGKYDETQSLVIDPVLVYSTYFGGMAHDAVVGVATDPGGNVYIAGNTTSSDFPSTAGAYDRTFNGHTDGFVAKLNPSGTRLIYSTVFGGTALDRAFDVAVDAAGQAHLTGHTTSADFPVSAGSVVRGCSGGACGIDAYALKLNAAGSGILYAARLGGTSTETGHGIALDADGGAAIVGSTRSTDFPVTAGAYQPVKRGSAFSEDYFVAKLNGTGSDLVFATYLGGSGPDDNLARVAIDPAGNIYVGSGTESRDFPVLHARQPGFAGGSDGFLASFGPFGNLVYSTYLGGSGFDSVRDIAVDADGAAYVTGRTTSADFPLVMALDSTLGGRDAFVTKFLPGGASLAYSTFLGGEGSDGGQGISVDGGGNAHVTISGGADFPITPDGAAPAGSDGGAFYARLDAAGDSLAFSSYIGPGFPQDLALDRSGNAFIGGETLGAPVTTRNSLQGASGGDGDGFLAKFGDWPALSPGEIVLYAKDASPVAGSWRVVSDPNAGGYAMLHHPDAGAAKLSNALPSPVHYFELTFTPEANRAYHLWIRGRAERDHWSNDSVFVQFSGSVNAAGTPVNRIDTGSAAAVNLEDCANCGLSGWGWQDNGYGAGVPGPVIYFESSAPQTLRVQTREDGMMIDQIVLSPGTWLDRAPGSLMQDTTVLPATGNADGGEQPHSPSPGEGEIVLHAASASLTGNWMLVADATAASGQRAWNPNADLPKQTTAHVDPADYMELTFIAEAGRGYRLWIRGKAEGDRWFNDSVHVQFLGSVDAGGQPIFRIGTTEATEYNLESCSGCGLSGWGWEDNGWGSGELGPLVYFEASGTQTIRIQTREDGLSIDQIVLSPAEYLRTSPGGTRNDTVILPESSTGTTTAPPSTPDIILYAADAPILAGTWRLEPDGSAADGRRAWNPDAGAPKLTTALAEPADFFELSFTAQAGIAYRLWIRGKAEDNRWANDSVHVQFSGSVDAGGAPTFEIGTTDSTAYNLESCSGCGLSGWGWEDNGWGSGVLGPLVYFAAAGPQTMRVQTREDGLSIDQIILSPERFLTASPGATKNDATTYPR